MSKTSLTVTEADTTGDSYTVVLDSQPTASVVVTVAGHAGTEVLPAPTTLTFTSTTWNTPQPVTVTAADDTDTANDEVTLTHSAASTDSAYDAIVIGGVTVTVEDNDTAQVTGVMVAPGNARLTVGWAAVANATGYEVQWKSGGQSYNTSDRQATVASGSTTSHTLPGLANDTAYTVRVRATRTGANDGPYSDEAMATPKAAGVTVSDDGADGDRGGHDRRQLHGGARQPADGERRGDGGWACGHGGAPGPDHADVHEHDLEYAAAGDGDGGGRHRHGER